MIYRIGASSPSFKTLSFAEGLNILVAVKTRDATSKQTRNSAGKTSVIEIIHFLMGSEVRKGSLFRAPELKDWSFNIKFDLAGEAVTVSRSCSEPGTLVIEEGETSSWPIRPKLDKVSGTLRLRNSDWKHVLGELMFRVSGEEDDPSGKGGPSFRQVFPYFARRQLAGGFQEPLKNSTQQQIGSIQVGMTALLGLDWSVPRELQQVRERETGLRELKKAVGAKALGDFVGNSTDLRKEAALLHERVAALRRDLAAFQVVAEYRELEKEAATFTRQMNALADENVLDAQARHSLEASIRDERPDSIRMDDLERFYKEAGVSLPGVVLRRFEDLQTFHESVVANRRSYLEGELSAVDQRIAGREAEKARLNQRLAQIMRILSSGRALDQFAELQAELSRREAEYESVRRRLDAAERLEGDKAKLGMERSRIFLRLQQDHREQAARVDAAIVTFEQISRALYESAGSFSVGESENGPKFELKIQGARSKGISNMQMFCLDMMLMKLIAERGEGPGFLVHDSHIFDGVDGRQIGTALSVGAALAKQHGFQYIVTMNEDAIPRECPPGFDPHAHVMPVRLTDASETGGLFGMRFE